MGERLPGPAGSAAWSRSSIRAQYNTNATLAENLLFGAPIGEAFDIDHLAAHPYVQRILEQAGLTTTLAGVGLELADTMVELFAELPPDHQYFTQYSFIGSEDLPSYRQLIGRADASKLDAVEPERPRTPDLADLQADPSTPSTQAGSTTRCKRGS